MFCFQRYIHPMIDPEMHIFLFFFADFFLRERFCHGSKIKLITSPAIELEIIRENSTISSDPTRDSNNSYSLSFLGLNKSKNELQISFENIFTVITQSMMNWL